MNISLSAAFFVAEWSGAIAGFSAILPRADDDTELGALFAEPTMWRRVAGPSLIEHFVKARQQGSGALHVVGNPHTETFYIACGFEKIGLTDSMYFMQAMRGR